MVDIEKEIFSFWQHSVTGCTGSCQNDNFRCSPWRQCCKNDIFVSVNLFATDEQVLDVAMTWHDVDQCARKLVSNMGHWSTKLVLSINQASPSHGKGIKQFVDNSLSVRLLFLFRGSPLSKGICVTGVNKILGETSHRKIRRLSENEDGSLPMAKKSDFKSSGKSIHTSTVRIASSIPTVFVRSRTINRSKRSQPNSNRHEVWEAGIIVFLTTFRDCFSSVIPGHVKTLSGN